MEKLPRFWIQWQVSFPPHIDTMRHEKNAYDEELLFEYDVDIGYILSDDEFLQ